MAVSKLFPGKLTIFDNVPVNYTAGLLNNISVTSAASYYANTINFTQHSMITPPSTYTLFSSNLG